MTDRRGFTLIELMVVIVIIVVMIGLMLPLLRHARQAGAAITCLGNVRHLEIAHWGYLNDHDGRFVNVGLPHSGAPAREDQAWVNTMTSYYGNHAILASPVDTSPHWGPAPAGKPLPRALDPDRRRVTSYGINNFLANPNHNGLNPYGKPPPDFPYWPGGDGYAFDRFERIIRPANTIHVVNMAYTGEYAAADHPLVEIWDNNGPDLAPSQAAKHLQINSISGPRESAEAVSNYGYLDGHAETNKFNDVYVDFQKNSFNPLVAR